MGTRVVDRLEDWPSRSFTDGHSGLRDLAADSFSGVVAAGGAELFMIQGTAVGIRRGDLADFEDTSGTIHEAPTPALPLLALMQEADVDVRAQYYSEETPMQEVDGTLSEGGFTGYVELSENVLSGDYYLVYHDGKRMAVGFVGNNRRLITDQEAFETADDEVGIYRVYQVAIEPIDLPGGGGAAAGGAGAAAGGAAVGADSEETAGDSGATSSETAESRTSASGDRSEVSVASSDPVAEDSPVDRPETDGVDEDASEGSGGEAAASAAAGDADTTARPGADKAGEPADAPEGDGESAPSGRSSEASTSPADLETRSIPSIDPARTQASQAGAAGVETPSEDQPRRASPADRSDSTGERATGSDPQAPSQASARTEDSTEGTAEPSASAPSGTSTPTDAELETALADREETIERLERELSQARAERDDLADQLEAVRAERDDLAARVEQLESQESETATAGTGASGGQGNGLSPAEAMAGTDIFVRYRSKENATLRKAHDGSVRREDVTDNLRLETHTQFDAGTVSVDGQGFREFLGARPEYQFVHWLVHDLLFEIRNTGHAQALSDLFDALPEIDRAQFDGTIETVYSDDGQETRSEEHFDIVLRDRMGNPLIVANINDSREGATESMMTDLVTAAERLGQTSEELAGAFLVTRSFFEPPALETASEATRSGMFSRDKRRSFVNISRKRGFHLCLVEARDQNFHLTVPEL